MKLILFLIGLFRLSSSLNNNVVEISCSFTISGSNYYCLLPIIEIEDIKNQTIVFNGQHVSGRDNENVSHVLFEPVSKIPFVLTEMFTTFPNVVEVWMMDIGLTRIQSGDFTSANCLEMLNIKNNSELTVIEANAFAGAHKLNYMELSNNSIENIHGSAFIGLGDVRQLYLRNNHIRKLPTNIFKSLKSLELLYLENNLIETLDGSVLSNNRNLTTAFFDSNKINAIGRTFLDGLEKLEVLAIRSNNCVDDLFSVYESSTIEFMHERLDKCYVNYDKQDTVEIYTLELHGNLLIRDENGNVIKLTNN